MSEIPDDIIEAGRLEAERYARWLHTMKTKGSLSPRAIEGLADIFGRLIFSERQRHAEVMEEVGKVLGNIVTAVEREPVVSNLDYPHAHNDWRGWRKKIMRPAVDEARALLSRLEER